MPTTLHQFIWYASLLACTGYALVRGGAPERFLASLFLLGCLATSLILYDPHAGVFQFGPMLITIAFDVALMTVALTSDRWWPLLAMAFQLTSAISFVASAVDRTTIIYAIYADRVAWDYLMLAVLAIGAHLEGCPRSA